MKLSNSHVVMVIIMLGAILAVVSSRIYLEEKESFEKIRLSRNFFEDHKVDIEHIKKEAKKDNKKIITMVEESPALQTFIGIVLGLIVIFAAYATNVDKSGKKINYFH